MFHLKSSDLDHYETMSHTSLAYTHCKWCQEQTTRPDCSKSVKFLLYDGGKCCSPAD